MSMETVRAFLQKAIVDAELSAAVNNVTDLDGLLKVAAGAGFTFSAEDWEAAGASFSDELTDAELDQVAGGTMQSENRSYAIVSNIINTKHDTVKNSISNVR